MNFLENVGEQAEKKTDQAFCWIFLTIEPLHCQKKTPIQHNKHFCLPKIHQLHGLKFICLYRHKSLIYPSRNIGKVCLKFRLQRFSQPLLAVDGAANSGNDVDILTLVLGLQQSAQKILTAIEFSPHIPGQRGGADP